MPRRTALVLLVDSAMLALVCVLECLHLTGLELHEWLGFALCPLVLVHVVWQWPWFLTQFRKFLRAPGARGRLNALLNTLLLVLMSAVLLSGVFNSRQAISLVGERFGSIRVWREMHHWLNFILVVCVALHLGLNWDWVLGVLTRRHRDRTARAAPALPLHARSRSMHLLLRRGLAVLPAALLSAGIAGSFTSVLGVARTNIARLNADGTLDAIFDPNPNSYVYSVALQADGKVLLGGGFTAVSPNGSGYVFPRQYLARILNEPATQNLSAPSPSQVVWTRGGTSPEVSQVTFELSTDGGTHWTALGNGLRVGTSANWQLTGLSLPASGQLRARGRTTGGNYNGSSGLIESVTSFEGLSQPPVINAQSLTKLEDGAFQFTFSNPNNIPFSVPASTNAAAPLTDWTVLGSPLNLGDGIYSFTDPAATNFSARFYLLRIP